MGKGGPPGLLRAPGRGGEAADLRVGSRVRRASPSRKRRTGRAAAAGGDKDALKVGPRTGSASRHAQASLRHRCSGSSQKSAPLLSESTALGRPLLAPRTECAGHRALSHHDRPPKPPEDARTLRYQGGNKASSLRFFRPQQSGAKYCVSYLRSAGPQREEKEKGGSLFFSPYLSLPCIYRMKPFLEVVWGSWRSL